MSQYRLFVKLHGAERDLGGLFMIWAWEGTLGWCGEGCLCPALRPSFCLGGRRQGQHSSHGPGWTQIPAHIVWLASVEQAVWVGRHSLVAFPFWDFKPWHEVTWRGTLLPHGHVRGSSILTIPTPGKRKECPVCGSPLTTRGRPTGGKAYGELVPLLSLFVTSNHQLFVF